METKTKLSLKDRILAILKLDEAGKVETFLEKQAKLLTKAIQVQKKNLEKFVIEAQDEIESLDEQLEDANQALNDAYTNITLEDIKTNELANEFSDIYWDNIDNCEAKIKSLEKQKENKLEMIKTETERVEKNISDLENKINNIK